VGPHRENCLTDLPKRTVGSVVLTSWYSKGEVDESSTTGASIRSAGSGKLSVANLVGKISTQKRSSRERLTLREEELKLPLLPVWRGFREKKKGLVGKRGPGGEKGEGSFAEEGGG